MKKLYSILFCLLLSFSVWADPNEKNANGNSGGPDYGEDKKSELGVEANEEPDEVDKTQESDSEPDSSYYSVNKFNFLFYFVYKMKYMDEEVEETTLED